VGIMKEILEMIFEKLQSIDERLLNPSPLPRLLTSQEAADYLGCKLQTLRAWRTQGTGPSYLKVEKCVRYSMDDLKKYVCQKKINIEPHQQEEDVCYLEEKEKIEKAQKEIKKSLTKINRIKNK